MGHSGCGTWRSKYEARRVALHSAVASGQPEAQLRSAVASGQPEAQLRSAVASGQPKAHQKCRTAEIAVE